MTPPFGTDGVRGRFGEEPLTEATVRGLGAAVGRHLAARGAAPTVLVAGDTRASSRLLARWIAKKSLKSPPMRRAIAINNFGILLLLMINQRKSN